MVLISECPKLAEKAMPGVAITVAESVPAGNFTTPEGFTIADVPAFCRVAATLKPSADSNIRVEVWLPIENWNRRFLGLGNGGFAGTLNPIALAQGLQRGFAVAHTDMGTSPNVAEGLVGRPERVIDWGWRSTHEMTLFSKSMTRALYAQAPSKSYFMGCSTGGGQGLHEAQRFPDDYDGIAVGAPANERVATHASILWNWMAVQASQAPALSGAKRTLWRDAVIKACDADDGVTDGLLGQPDKCAWTPRLQQCAGADGPDCFTAEEATAIEKIYEGPKDTRTGARIFAGLSKGTEENTSVYAFFPTFPVFGELFQIVFGTDWDWRGFDFGVDFQASQAAIGSTVNADVPDLRAFKSRGGKMIMYTGWADQFIAPKQTIDYFKRIDSASNASTFARLFVAPGMAHCGGGSAPNYFGQDVGTAPFAGDASRDLLTALMQWSEGGAAPNTLVATQYSDGNASTGSIVRTRPLCAFPKVARYLGAGSTDVAENFSCADPD
jgi:feruloyl esterase